MQNLQNFYPRRKRTAYYEILPLRVQILLKRRTREQATEYSAKNKQNTANKAVSGMTDQGFACASATGTREPRNH